MRAALLLACALALVGTVGARGASVVDQRLGGAALDESFLANDPPLAIDRSGHAVALVSVRRHLALTTARPGRRFSRLRLLPGADRSRTPGLDVAPNGAAAVAWVRGDGSRPADPESRDDGCCNRVRAVVVRPDGRRSRTHTISISLPYGPANEPLTLATGRRAAVAFTDDRGVRVATADTRSTRGFGPAVTLAHAGKPLQLWMVGRTPHVLVLETTGYRPLKLRAVELFRRGGRTVRRVRTRAFSSSSSRPSVARARGGRLLAAFEVGGRGQHVLLQRNRSGRVRVDTLPGSAVQVAVALSPHHGWIAAGGRRSMSLRRLDGGPRQRFALRPGHRQYPTDLALGVDDRGRGALGAYDNSRRSRRLSAFLGRGLRPMRRFEVAPSEDGFVAGLESGVSVLPQTGGRALVAFARDDVRAVPVGP